MDALAGRPFLRKVILRLPRFLQPGPKPFSQVLAVDSADRVMASLRDPDTAYPYPNITGAAEADGYLYLASVWGGSIGRAPLPGRPGRLNRSPLAFPFQLHASGSSLTLVVASNS